MLPSVNTIQQGLNVDRKKALEIRRILELNTPDDKAKILYKMEQKGAYPEAWKQLVGWHGNPRLHDIKMFILDELIGGFGVEAIRGSRNWDSFYCDICGEYVNLGDTYDCTLLYDTVKRKYLITSWGDWVELRTEEYGIE
jgi:hypothetical protein